MNRRHVKSFTSTGIGFDDVESGSKADDDGNERSLSSRPQHPSRRGIIINDISCRSLRLFLIRTPLLIKGLICITILMFLLIIVVVLLGSSSSSASTAAITGLTVVDDFAYRIKMKNVANKIKSKIKQFIEDQKQVEDIFNKDYIILKDNFEKWLLEPLEQANHNNKNSPIYKTIKWMSKSNIIKPTLQRYSLGVLYFATGGDRHWKTCSHLPSKTPCYEHENEIRHDQVRLLTMSSKTNECHWFGVTCNDNNDVIRISWTNNSLSFVQQTQTQQQSQQQQRGSVWPFELLLLKDTLELLWLSDNPLAATLSDTSSSGTNNDDGSLTQNTRINSIPTWISYMINLRSLSLYDTQLKGSIPTQLYSLNKLESIRLYNNQLTGSISSTYVSSKFASSKRKNSNNNNNNKKKSKSTITSGSKLSWLWLHNNRLTGTIPKELGYISSLTGLTLHGNQFVDSKYPPVELCNLLQQQTGNKKGGNSKLEHLWMDCSDDVTKDNEPCCTCCTKCFVNPIDD